MRLDGFIAEPPEDFLTADKRFELVLGVGMKQTPAHAPRQNRQDFFRVTQVRHHTHGVRNGDVEGFVEIIVVAQQCFGRATHRNLSTSHQSFSEALPSDGTDVFDGVYFASLPLVR